MTDPLLDHYRMLARYNAGANHRLYEACEGLSDTERKRDRKGFFASIHGTLNHLMVGDRIWMARFEGGSAPSTGLDQTLYEEFAALRKAREAEDARISGFVERLDSSFFEGTIRYINNEGRNLEDPAMLLFAHFFNHQTHHRGQVHDMLCQTGHPTPVLDMHRVINP
jgi:uncharacterized damage-inducible protein DinB